MTGRSSRSSTAFLRGALRALRAAAPPRACAVPRGGWRAAGGMGLLQDCQAAFGAADLYRALGVRREASPEEIRRAYHRASLRVHPDRAEPDAKEEATRLFQVSAGGRLAGWLADRATG